MQNIPALTNPSSGINGTSPSQGSVQLYRLPQPPVGSCNTSDQPTAASNAQPALLRCALAGALVPPSAKQAGQPYLPNRATVYLNSKAQFSLRPTYAKDSNIMCRHLATTYLQDRLQGPLLNREILPALSTIERIQQHVEPLTDEFVRLIQRCSPEIQLFSNDCCGKLLLATQTELLTHLANRDSQTSLPSNILLAPSDNILALKGMYIESEVHAMALIVAIKFKPEKFEGKPYLVVWVYDPNATNNCARLEMELHDPAIIQLKFSDFIGLRKTKQAQQSYARDMITDSEQDNLHQAMLIAYTPMFTTQETDRTPIFRSYTNPQQRYATNIINIACFTQSQLLPLLEAVTEISNFDVPTCNTILGERMYSALCNDKMQTISALSSMLGNLPELQRTALDWQRLLIGKWGDDDTCGLEFALAKNNVNAIKALQTLVHKIPEVVRNTLNLEPIAANDWLQGKPSAETWQAFKQLQALLKPQIAINGGKKLQRHEAIYRSKRPQITRPLKGRAKESVV